MGKKILKIAGIQFAASESKEKNIERAKHLANLAYDEGVKIISFSELFNTIWFPHIEGGDISIKKKYSETIPGPTVEEFSLLAKKWEMVVVLPISEIDGDIFYNSAAVIDADGKLLGVYRKVHIPRLPLWYEKDYFTPGDRLFPVFVTKYIRLGVQICWDNFFPEGSRAIGLGGAQLIVCPTASAMKTFERWEKVISANAIANGLFALRINRTGSEAAQDFYGETFCVNPEGEIISEPAGMNDSVSIFEINTAEIEETRKMWPFFEDRRPETYNEIVKKKK